MMELTLLAIALLIIFTFLISESLKEKNRQLQEANNRYNNLQKDNASMIEKNFRLTIENLELKDKLTIAYFNIDELKNNAKKQYQKLYYARKRIPALELEIVGLTGNKKRLSGNSFKN